MVEERNVEWLSWLRGSIQLHLSDWQEEEVHWAHGWHLNFTKEALSPWGSALFLSFIYKYLYLIISKFSFRIARMENQHLPYYDKMSETDPFLLILHKCKWSPMLWILWMVPPGWWLLICSSSPISASQAAYFLFPASIQPISPSHFLKS